MSLISEMFGDETVDPFLSMVNRCPVLSTPTDWKETKDAHVFIADLPGLKKEQVKVEVDEGRVLQISGDWNVDKDDDKNNKWHRVERCRGMFQRSFRLPDNAKVDQVKAHMQNEWRACCHYPQAGGQETPNQDHSDSGKLTQQSRHQRYK